MNLHLMGTLAVEWAIRCFGFEHVRDKKVRALRFVEEAIELCQSLDVSKEDVEKVLALTYSRPKGDPQQEVGGVIITLLVLCDSMFVSPEDEAFRELRRILAKDPAIFAQRNLEKVFPSA